MSQYQHHPDSLIYVRTSAATYVDSVANFAKDFGRISPLPDRVTHSLYDDQKRIHFQFDADGNQLAAGTVPFPFGDAAIAAIDTLLKNQAARRAPALFAPPPSGTRVV